MGTLIAKLRSPSGGGAEDCDDRVCVSVCLHVSLSASRSEKRDDQTLHNLPRWLLVAVARSFSDCVAIRYVFPVLWKTYVILPAIRQAKATRVRVSLGMNRRKSTIRWRRSLMSIRLLGFICFHIRSNRRPFVFIFYIRRKQGKNKINKLNNEEIAKLTFCTVCEIQPERNRLECRWNVVIIRCQSRV